MEPCISHHNRKDGAFVCHEQLRENKTAILMGLLRVVIYGVLGLLFFGLMAINNWQLLHMSRTLGTTLLTYVAMSAAMHAVYGGYAVGKKKSKPIISSMSLATLITDLVTYLQLQIMNVNENNNDYLELFGSDFPWLLVCMALQVLLITYWVRFGNNFYFTINPPRKCLVVLGSMDEEEAVCRKIRRYALQWEIKRIVLWNDPKLLRHVRQAEVVFLGNLPEDTKMSLLRTCYEEHRDVMCKAQLQDIMLSNATLMVVDDAPFLEMDYGKITLGQRIVKRLMDIVVSLAVLTVLAPVYGIIAICIHAEDGGPVLFRQKRMTVGGKEFKICKFRTMKENASLEPHQSSVTVDDPRITRVGKLLRKTGVDEFPQFLNVFIGDMSIVGPRPPLPKEVAQYDRWQMRRLAMKPGITCIWQVAPNRNNISFEDWVKMDMEYIDNWSLTLDFVLILKTVGTIFRADGK